MIFDIGGDLAAESHEVVKDDANDMEAIGDDAGIGEPHFDEVAAGRTKTKRTRSRPWREEIKEMLFFSIPMGLRQLLTKK